MLQLQTVPAKGKQKKKKKHHSVLFRLKGGKEAVAEAGGRVAEENRTSQGVSLPEKQGWVSGLASLCSGSFLLSKVGDGAPPARRSPHSLAASSIDHGIHTGLFVLHTGHP